MMNDYRTSGETTTRNYGPSGTMDQVWDDVMSGLQEDFGVEMYEESRLQTNIEIFEDIYNHELTKVQAQVKQVHDIDLLPLRIASQERVGGLLPARGGQTPRSARGMTFPTKEASWHRHFTTNSEGEIVNSRHTRFEMARYDVDFMNYIFERPLITSKQSEAEISKQKYYYAVVKGKDYDKILQTGRIPIGREKYYPLNWSQNPVEAFRFMDYLVRFDHEAKGADDGDYRMIALPLDVRVGEERTKARAGHKASVNAEQTLKLQEFNRHYGGYYYFFKKDEMVEHPTKVRKYMETNPIEIDFPVTTKHDPEGLDVTMTAASSEMKLPVPLAAGSSSTTPLPEDKYHGWIDLNANQLLHLHSWHIPQDAMGNYMGMHSDDPDVYVDFTTYYRENELAQVYSAYGGLLNGPSWARVVRWWHGTNRTYTSTNPERKKELTYV